MLSNLKIMKNRRHCHFKGLCNLLTLNLPDEGYIRNTLCAVKYTPTFLIHLCFDNLPFTKQFAGNERYYISRSDFLRINENVLYLKTSKPKKCNANDTLSES